MYYNNKNLNQKIYYPNAIHYPINQKKFYSNSTQKQINDLDNFYNLLNDRLDVRYNDLYKKTIDLDATYMNLVDLQKKTDGELSQHKYRQENLKKRLLNRLYRLENIIHEELQFFTTNQENVNKTLFEQFDQQEKVVFEKLQPVIQQQERLKRQVLNRLEQLDTHEMIILEELQPFINNIQDNLANPIANLLKNLSPGTSIEQLTVHGAEIAIRSFLDYNLFTNTSTFLLENNKILSINTNRIDSLTFS